MQFVPVGLEDFLVLVVHRLFAFRHYFFQSSQIVLGHRSHQSPNRLDQLESLGQLRLDQFNFRFLRPVGDFTLQLDDGVLNRRRPRRE